ncbi:MAG TPA: amino acid permease [Gemmatimonadaceae bacterium]|nr:amino acid permease [Gemmatimonadaceae bacterium]
MEPTQPQGLKRQIGLWSAIAIVIGTTIGSGIFRSPAGIADRLPGPLPLAIIWVAGGIFALCGALSFAELSSAFPRTGGVFVYIKEGWGKLPAFLFGWAEITVIRAAAVGAISMTFAEYLLRVIGVDPGEYARYVAAAAIIAMGTVNILGVRWGTLVINLTTIAKYGGLVFIVVISLALGLPQTGGHYTPAMPPGSFSMAPFGLALVSVLWAYDGYADLSYSGGEVKDPERNLPRALIIGTLAIITIYLLANIAYLAVIPVEEMRRSKLVAADVAERLLGSAGVVFIGVTVMLSTWGTLTGSLFTSPRIFFAMADDGLFFKSVAKVHPRFHTPHIAITINIVLGVIFVLMRTFEQLADAFVTAIVPFYALGVAALFVVRRRADYKPPFRTPGYPFVPALFVLSAIYLLANALVDPTSRVATAITLGIVLLGIPVYYLTVGKRRVEG